MHPFSGILPYNDGMRLFDLLATAFITTFGITQPSEATRRRASWFILFMMVLTVAVVAAIGYAFYAAMHGSGAA